MKHEMRTMTASESACKITGEQATELMFKASKVSAWLTALKKKAEFRPQEGVSEDASVVVTVRNYRIVSIQMREDVSQMAIDEILPRICQAHNDALDRIESWLTAQYETIAKTFGIGDDVQLPF